MRYRPPYTNRAYIVMEFGSVPVVTPPPHFGGGVVFFLPFSGKLWYDSRRAIFQRSDPHANNL